MFASAQSVNLTFPDDGDRQVWVFDTLPSQPPADSAGIRTSKSEAVLPVSGEKATSAVFVWDRKKGNLASKTLKDVATANWIVKPEDFQDVAEVVVQVEHGGKPVAAASVELNDTRRTQTQLLDPSSKGTVTFFAVKPGTLKITVHFKVAGKDGQPVTQELNAKLDRTDAIPTAKISLADEVDTVGGAASGTGASSPASTAGSDQAGADNKPKKADEEGAGSIVGKILVYLIALGAAIAAVYFGMLYVKKNPDSVGSKLEQLGVQLPKPGDDPLANPSQLAAAPVKPTPAPVQKIILDDAAPEPLIGSPMIATAPTFGGEPRIVSASGDAMTLPEGEFVVGREIGLGLSLVGESTVSRRHAQLLRNGNQVVVKDLGSTNGTYVNGVQLQGEKVLQPGDNVQFGQVRFRYEG